MPGLERRDPAAKSSAPGKAGRTRRAPGPPLDPWRRWPVFAMLAHALLTVIDAHDDATRPTPAG
ncbi:hypothetical protein ACQEVO_14050 [Nocardia sp. CA-290969]